MKRWLLVLVLLAACGGGGTAPTTTVAPTTSADPNAAPQNAIDECHAVVKKRLKSPGTAAFEPDEPLHTELSPVGAQIFIISGTVDSENGFGALIRSEYECISSPTTDFDAAGNVVYSAEVSHIR